MSLIASFTEAAVFNTFSPGRANTAAMSVRHNHTRMRKEPFPKSSKRLRVAVCKRLRVQDLLPGRANAAATSGRHSPTRMRKEPSSKSSKCLRSIAVCKHLPLRVPWSRRKRSCWMHSTHLSARSISISLPVGRTFNSLLSQSSSISRRAAAPWRGTPAECPSAS